MFIYRILFLPATLLGLPYYAYRMWRRGGYRNGFKNRFGITGKVPPKQQNVNRIWIQAVSVGELLAIEPLLKALNKDTTTEVVLTTTTSTGLRLLQDRLAGYTVWNGVFPLDFWACSRRAWQHLQPDMALLLEGELWPEHIHQAYIRNIPVVLANARLSDRSHARHQRLVRITRPYFQKIHTILTSSASDHQRFTELKWISSNRIHSMGNLKLDIESPHPPGETEKKALFSEMGFSDGPVTLLLGSSTWPGEELALLNAFQ